MEPDEWDLVNADGLGGPGCNVFQYLRMGFVCAKSAFSHRRPPTVGDYMLAPTFLPHLYLLSEARVFEGFPLI